MSVRVRVPGIVREVGAVCLLGATLALGAPIKVSPPPAPPVRLVLNGGALKMRQSGKKPGHYESIQPLSLKAVSLVKNWRLVCVASPLTGPAKGVINPGQLTFALRGPGKVTAGQAIAAPLFSGGLSGTQVAAVGDLDVQAQVPLTTPTGVYSGKLTLYAEVAGGGAAVPLGETPITLDLPESFEISLVHDTLEFGNVLPLGESWAVTPIQLQVTTNLSNQTLQLSMSQLKQVNGLVIFPNNQVALGIGFDAAAAKNNAEHNTLGTTTITFPIPNPGTYTIFIHGRLTVNLTNPAGTYQGTITVTGAEW